MPPQLTNPLFLLVHGTPPSRKLAQALAKKSSAVLCTDGSYGTALKLGLKPRWVIGDMDSLPPTQRIEKGTIVVLEDEQDSSDFEKAVKFLLQFGCDRAHVAGMEGGRIDHFMTALSVTVKYAAKIRLMFYGENHVTELLTKGTRFKAKKGEVVSLVPVDNPSWVTISGVRFPMKREPLFAGSRGQSNVAAGGNVSVEVHSGKVWLIRNCLP